MTAYAFKAQFVPPILSGRKRQTIRKLRLGRSRHAQEGEALQLYCRQRHPTGFKIADATCSGVLPIGIEITPRVERVRIGTRRVTEIASVPGLDRLAQRDGFVEWPEMRSFWRQHHAGANSVVDFTGVLILWRGFVAAEAARLRHAA